MEVNPCTHCLSKDLDVIKEGFRIDVLYYVLCRSCMSRGPSSETLEGAVIGWNSRREVEKKDQIILFYRDRLRELLRMFCIKKASSVFVCGCNSVKVVGKNHQFLKNLDNSVLHYEKRGVYQKA